jgi:hypothetical protein
MRNYKGDLMKRTNTVRTFGLVALIAMTLSLAARADLTNGGFEAGFTGWTRADQLGSDGTFFLQTGTTSPVSGNPVPAPPEGATAAMTDALGPGSHVLYQKFTPTSAVPSAILSFDLFVGNRADDFYIPNHLDFSTTDLNQQARVDILFGGADPFSLAGGDVLLNAFRTNPGDPLVSGYTHYAVDVTSILNANLGTELMLRFAEVDNVFTFNFGVDNVHLEASEVTAVPEPSTMVMGLTSLLGMAGLRRRFR